MAGKRRAYFDIGPRAVLVGVAPPRPELNICAPLVSGATGRRLERLAGVPRNHLQYYYATENLFARYESQYCRPSRRRATGTTLVRSYPGRVLVLLGVEVRWACGYEWLEWGRWYDDLGDWLVAALPHPSGRTRWYNSAENRAVASRVLESARVAALGFGLWQEASATT